jgi:hypothetical protein
VKQFRIFRAPLIKELDMGLSYTVCYCRDGSKCKGRASEKDKFNEAHWGEVRENLKRYLNEPICVPGATGQEPAPEEVESAVTDYMQAIAESRSHHFSGDYAMWHRRRVTTAQALARLSELPSELLSGQGESNQASSAADPQVSVDIDEVTRLVMEMADLLADSYRRAAIELVSSVQSKQDIHIFHHFGLLTDIVAEMHALAIQATAHISTENMLPNDHPHRTAIERRQQSDAATVSP